MTDQPFSITTSTPPRWVWYCTNASIEARQISVLATVETLLVLLLYIWLAFHFDKQCWLLLSAVAAPIILLRSEESKAYGLELLKEYRDELGREHLTQREVALLGLLVLLCSCILTNRWGQAWLSGHTLDTLDGTAFLVGVLGVTIQVAVAAIVAGVFAARGENAFLYMLVLPLAAMAGYVAIVAAFATGTQVAGENAGEGAFVAAYVFANGIAEKEDLFAIKIGEKEERDSNINCARMLVISFIGEYFGLGIWLRCLAIRIYATLRHPIAGLRNLPRNWRDILFSVDFLHLPELLPGASKVDNLFSFTGLLIGVAESVKIGNIKKGRSYGSMIELWYFPALFWRWSLIATLWLWWPLALLLQPPLDGLSADRVRDQVAVYALNSNRWLTKLAWLMLIWILFSLWPVLQPWLTALGDAWQKPLQQLLTLAPPPAGLRFYALVLCCCLTLIVDWQVSRMMNMHKQVLEEEKTFEELPEPRKSLFVQRARQLERWRTAQVVAFILLGYAVSLWLGCEYYPAETDRFISTWVRSYL